MPEPRTVKLTGEKETLLVPLWSKAVGARRDPPLIEDPTALAILDRIDYDFAALGIPDKTAVMLCLRALKLDAVTRAFLAVHPRGTVLHLGCGLDARCERVDRGGSSWFDVDYPEVIDLRWRFFEDAPGYRMIPSSVTDLAWLAQVPDPEDGALVIAEGLLMYLREEEIRALLAELRRRFGAVELAFDAYSKLTARRAARHPSLRKTGATIHWGLDDPAELEGWGVGARVQEEWSFSDAEELDRLDGLTRAMFRMAGWFQAARRAHRILRVDLAGDRS